jgi:hypothetical protein
VLYREQKFVNVNKRRAPRSAMAVDVVLISGKLARLFFRPVNQADYPVVDVRLEYRQVIVFGEVVIEIKLLYSHKTMIFNPLA